MRKVENLKKKSAKGASSRTRTRELMTMRTWSATNNLQGRLICLKGCSLQALEILII